MAIAHIKFKGLLLLVDLVISHGLTFFAFFFRAGGIQKNDGILVIYIVAKCIC